MKKPSLKNLLSVSGAVLFTLCCIWLVAQSNANDDASIMIDTSKYTATQHIQEVHLNNKDFSDRVGLKNLNGVSLGIGEIGSNGRAVSPKNGVGDDASVIAGVSNRNSGGEASLIVGGERNVINDNLNNSVIMGGKANQVKASSVILLTSSGVIANQNGVAVGVNKGTIGAPNALIFAGEDTHVNGEDSMAIGSNITVNSPGTFVFNGSSTPSPLSELLSGYTSHAFIIKADNGLIVGGIKNKASAVDLTVSGAVKIGDAKGVALNDRNIKGAVFRVKCSSPADASCLCANENGIIKSISSNPACDGVCKNGNGSCESGNLCGSASRSDYAAAETDRRANTTFCAVGAHLKEEIVGSGPLALHKNPRPSFPGPGKNVQWTCVSDFQDSVMMVCIAKRKDIKKENAECGTYNGISFTGAMMTAWPAGGTFCKKGTPTPTNPAFPMTGKPVTWTCGGANLIPVQCSANGCNRCSKDGFPYCFPVDLDPSCNLIPVQPEEAHCGAAINTCNPGNVEDVPDTAAEYKWKCNWKLTSKMCSKPKSTTTYNCIGSDFANAYPVLGDDKNLTANTAKKLVASDTSAKCEWLCNSGYTLQNGACVKLNSGKCVKNILWGNDCRPVKLEKSKIKWLYCDYANQNKSAFKCPVFEDRIMGKGIEILDRNLLSPLINRYLPGYYPWRYKPLGIKSMGNYIVIEGIYSSFWDDIIQLHGNTQEEKCIERQRLSNGACIPTMRVNRIYATNYESAYEVEHISTTSSHIEIVDLNDRYREIQGIVNSSGELFENYDTNMTRLTEANSSLCKSFNGSCESQIEGITCEIVETEYSKRCKGIVDKSSCQKVRYCIWDE